MSIALTPREFSTLFPFHLTFGSDLTIVQLGTSLQRLCPELGPGQCLTSYFSIVRPTLTTGFDSIRDQCEQLFLLSHCSRHLKLRGQMLPLDDGNTIAFLCSPWVNGTSDWVELGLQFNDFPLHNPLPDFIQVLQTRVNAEADLRRLTTILTAQRAELADLAERLKTAAAAAKSASTAKTEFVAGLSHEIRTPLNAIVGMTELLGGTNLDARQRQFLEIIRTGSEALRYLIDDMLDISRIEAGKIELTSGAFSPDKVCEEAVAFVYQSAQQKGLDIYYRAVPALPPAIVGDRNRFRQILVNLLTNGIKFTSEGHLSVTLTWAINPGGEVELACDVQDTGPGVPPTHREKIFEKFVSLNWSGTEPALGGIGVGLAISRSLATAMGGSITVDSIAGSGSIFRFHLTAPLATCSPEDNQSVLERSKLLSALVLAPPGSAPEIASCISAWGIQTHIASRDASLHSSLVAEFGLVVCDESHLPELIRALPNQSDTSPAVLLVGRQQRSGWFGTAVPENLKVVAQPLIPSRILTFLRALFGLSRDVAAVSPPALAADFAGPRPPILVAEDSPEGRILFRHLLVDAGFTVDFVSDGHAAAQHATCSEYGAIIMDMQMPMMDGLEATSRIRQSEALRSETARRHGKSGNFRRVPIIVVTAHAGRNFRDRALAAGADHYLTKPITRETLLNALQQYVAPKPVILVVAPDPAVQQLILSCLSSGKFEVLCAGDVETAHDLISHRDIALLFLDMHPEPGAGMALAQKLSASGHSRIPVVMLSGLADRPKDDTWIGSGCVDIVEKPFSPDQILSIVHRHIPNSQTSGRATTVESPSRLSELVPRFLTKVRELVSALQAAVAENDRETISVIGHRLKGSGGGYGFYRISSLGREIEQAASRDDFGQARHAIQQLAGYVESIEWSVKDSDHETRIQA